MKNQRCWNCRQRGHSIRECPAPRPPPCEICKQAGKNTRNSFCPHRQHAEDGPSTSSQPDMAAGGDDVPFGGVLGADFLRMSGMCWSAKSGTLKFTLPDKESSDSNGDQASAKLKEKEEEKKTHVMCVDVDVNGIPVTGVISTACSTTSLHVHFIHSLRQKGVIIKQTDKPSPSPYQPNVRPVAAAEVTLSIGENNWTGEVLFFKNANYPIVLGVDWITGLGVDMMWGPRQQVITLPKSPKQPKVYCPKEFYENKIWTF